MGRLTKYSNDLIRRKAISILRKLDGKNGLTGDELAIISSFCLIERLENKQLKKFEDLEEQGRLPESSSVCDTDKVIEQISAATGIDGLVFYVDGRPVIYKEQAIEIIRQGGQQDV